MVIITQNEQNNFYLFNRASQQASLELTMQARLVSKHSDPPAATFQFVKWSYCLGYLSLNVLAYKLHFGSTSFSSPSNVPKQSCQGFMWPCGFKIMSQTLYMCFLFGLNWGIPSCSSGQFYMWLPDQEKNSLSLTIEALMSQINTSHCSCHQNSDSSSVSHRVADLQGSD